MKTLEELKKELDATRAAVYETYHLRAVALHKAQKAYEEAFNDYKLGDQLEEL